MSYTNGLDDPSAYFQTILYSGNETARSITLDGNSDLQPDWVWIKQRSRADPHILYDSVRGTTKELSSNTSTVEHTNTAGLTSFNSDGFNIGNHVDVNRNSTTFVAWNWKAGGTASSNTDGSITSTVSANTTSGFSIVTYTGNGSSGSTIGHGLNAVPEVVLIRRRNQSTDWNFQLGYSQYLKLNSTDQAIATSGGLVGSGSTSTITVDANAYVNASGSTYVGYFFVSKKGYSKFGSYTGNGNNDGTFVYTGFKPAFVLVKRTDGVSNWGLIDNTRDPFNVTYHFLEPNVSDDEFIPSAPQEAFDFCSQGFKCRSTNGAINASGGTYIYMCFASNPFVTSTGIPTTAR